MPGRSWKTLQPFPIIIANANARCIIHKAHAHVGKFQMIKFGSMTSQTPVKVTQSLNICAT